MPDSARPVAVVEAYCDAWASGDVATVVGLYADDLVLIWPGRHHLAGRYEGKDGALDALLRFQAATGRSLHELHGVVSGPGDVVLAWWTERWAVGDDAVDVERIARYRVADGRIVECAMVEVEPGTVDGWIDVHRPD